MVVTKNIFGKRQHPARKHGYLFPEITGKPGAGSHGQYRCCPEIERPTFCHPMQKNIALALILLAWFLLFGCARTGTEPHIPGQPAAETVDPVFKKAEGFFNQGDLDQALAAYNHYLALQPEGRYAAWALQRVASIYRTQGRSELALDIYDRFLERYGTSAMAEQVRIERLSLMLELQRFSDVIDGAIRLLDKTTNSRSLRSLWMMLAKAYSAIGDYADAAYYYHKLYLEADAAGKKQIIEKFEDAISRLSRSEAEMLLEAFTDSFSRSRLMYRYAQALINENLYDQALEVLTKFQESYPDHELSAGVQALMAQIESEFTFEPYTLGCLLPLSGPYKVWGQRALQGLELALDQVSKDLGSPPFRMLVKDTAGEPGRAAKAVEDLVAEKVGLIIGPAFTADAAASVAQQLQVPIITLTQKAGVTDIGGYVFRNFMTPAMQVKALVSYALDNLNLQHFAILYPDDNYGNTFMELFWDQVIAGGGQVVGAEAYDPEQTDFAAPIARLTGTYYKVPADLRKRPLVMVDKPRELADPEEKNDSRLGKLVADFTSLWTGLYWDNTLGRGEKRVDNGEKNPIIDFEAIFVPDSAKAAGMILPQLAYYDISDVFLLGTNLWHSKHLINLAGQYARNAVIAEGFFADSDYPPVKQFVKRFKQVYGRLPGVIEAFTYDTTALALRLIADPALKLRIQLKRKLATVYDEQAVTGPTVFDSDGEAQKPLYLLRVKGGRFAELKHP